MKLISKKSVFSLFLVLVLAGGAYVGLNWDMDSETMPDEEVVDFEEVINSEEVVNFEELLPLENSQLVVREDDSGVGPYSHFVHAASSEDGLTFTEDFENALVRYASVPAAIVRDDGMIVVYFVDGSQLLGGLGCVISQDGGLTYTWGDCFVDGYLAETIVDFSVVTLPDGRYRMYYYAVEGNDVHKEGDHSVESAISDDGINFVSEGAAFTYEGLVDPDVFWNGEMWIMHVYNIQAEGTVVATSVDGTSFEYRGMLEPDGYGVTKPITLVDGTFRMYGFNQPSSTIFESFISEDGLTWEKEEGIRLEYDEKVTDPFVVELQDGTYKMYFKTG